MQRILYCTDLLMSGGVERQVTELAKRLDRARYAPHLMYLYGERAGRSEHFVTELLAAGVPLHALDLTYSPLDKVRGLIRIARHVWRIRPHVLHVYNYHSNLLARMARPALPPSMALVGSVRTAYTAKQLRYERWSYRACAVIVCNSPHLHAQLAEQARIPANRILYIPNGVDINRFAANPDPIESARLRSNARHMLVMFGRIAEQKSPHLLAEALGLLKDRRRLPEGLRAVIVGEREDETYQRKLDEAIVHYGLQDIVCQYPQTARPEVFYHAGDVTVLATLWEGLPNVALESLAAGRPVIISEAANAARIIDHNTNGWIVRTGDVAHLSETLAAVLALPQDRMSSMQAACLRRSVDFSMERMVQRYEDLYARLRAMPSP